MKRKRPKLRQFRRNSPEILAAADDRRFYVRLPDGGLFGPVNLGTAKVLVDAPEYAKAARRAGAI
jgi:hypothetical protein